MTHDEELGRRALRPVVDRFVRANVDRVIPREKSQVLSNGSCQKDKTQSLLCWLPESPLLSKFPKNRSDFRELDLDWQSSSADAIRRNAGAATLFEARVFKDLCFAAAALSRAPLT